MCWAIIPNGPSPPAVIDNLFYSLTASRDGQTAAAFYVLRDGSAIFRTDNGRPQALYGSLQNVMDYIGQKQPEILLTTDPRCTLQRLSLPLPEIFRQYGEISYSSSARSVLRINSQGILLPRRSGSAHINVRITMGDETASLSLPVIIND